MTDYAVRLRIRGRVQGVGYRYWAADEARRLGLSGWVRNRHDGSVETLIAGRAERVAEMTARCHEGPSMACVSRVDEEVVPAPVGRGFEILPTV